MSKKIKSITTTDNDAEKLEQPGVDSFQGIIDKKKVLMEEALAQAERSATTRQKRLIEALVRVRKSLRDVEKIDMGQRFYLKLLLDDYDGWPRMTLKTIDSKDPTREYPDFIVSSHDRQESGSIVIETGVKAKPHTISLADISNVTKLSIMIKKHLRQHLDLIGDRVVQVEQDDGRQAKVFYKDDNQSRKPTVQDQGPDDDRIPLSLDI